MATWLLTLPREICNGEIHNRLMLKVVTFCNATSQTLHQQKDFKREILELRVMVIK